MADKKSLDELVKGINDVANLTIHDAFKLKDAVYVSSKDNVEGMDLSQSPDKSAADKKFEAAAKKIKSMMGDRSAIVAKAEATHYDFVNKNFYYYDLAYMRQNATTWIQKTNTGSWGKPVQKDHWIDTDASVGRVLGATPIIYPTRSNDIWVPNGHIELVYYVPDKDAIDRMIDGRFRTLSVSASATPKDVKCSICGRTINDYECDHYRGKTYSITDERTKKTTDRLCYWIWGKQVYNEVSFVQKPADADADTYEMSFINIDGKDNFDENTNDTAHVDTRVSLMSADIENGLLQNLLDSEENNVETLYAADSIVDETMHIEVKKSDVDQTDSSGKGDSTTDNNDADDTVTTDCGSDDNNNDTTINDTDTLDDQSVGTFDSHSVRSATLGLIQDMLKNKYLTIDDAVDALFDENEIYISRDNRSNDTILQLLDEELTSADAPLSIKKRKTLKQSTYCGPNKTFPVPDCAHVIAAKRLMTKFSGTDETKERIINGINRKSKVLFVDDSETTKDNLQEDSNMATKLTFESVDELLESAQVQKYLEEKTTDHEQQLDKIKKASDEKEDKFMKIAIDSIIDLSVKIGRPLTASLKDKEGDDRTQAMDSITEKLKNRGLDSLTYLLEDLREELNLVVEDNNGEESSDQAAIDAANKAGLAVKGKGEEGNDGEGSNGTNTSDSDGNDGDDSTNASADVINQDDATGEEVGSSLSSFTKPVKN
jgi:hypothetical protein